MQLSPTPCLNTQSHFQNLAFPKHRHLLLNFLFPVALYVQFTDLVAEPSDLHFVVFQGWSHVLHQYLLHYLRASANKCTAIRQDVQLVPDWLEEIVGLDTLKQIVGLSFLLDDGTCLVGQDTDLLVGFLTRNTLVDHGHDDVLRGHKWELEVDALLDDGLVDNETRRNVVQLVDIVSLVFTRERYTRSKEIVAFNLD